MGEPEENSQKRDHHAFMKNVLILVSGTAIAQLIAILGTPVITRIYDPAAFGSLALFLSITSLIGVVICLKYEAAIMLPHSDEEAAQLFGLCLGISLLLSILVLFITIAGYTFFASWLNAPDLNLWLIPLFSFFFGLFLAFNYWNIRKQKYGRQSRALVARAVATTGTQISAGVAGSATGGSLIAGAVIGQIVSATVLGIRIWRDDLEYLKKHITRKGMLSGLKRYRNFPLYDTWSDLLNTLSAQLPVFLLTYYFLSTVVGYYALALMVVQLPMGLIGGSIGNVFFQNASLAKHKEIGEIAVLLEDTVLTLIKIGILPALMLLFFGEDLFFVVFGSDWTESGQIAAIITPWVFLVFITSPISTLFSIFEKQRMTLVLNIIALVLRGGSLIIGGMLGSPVIALVLFTLSGIGTNSWALNWCFTRCNLKLSGSLVKLKKLLLLFFVVLSLFLLKIQFSLPSIEIVLVLLAISIVYYFIIIKSTPMLSSLIPYQLKKYI
jgi:lipopolysaccharide exporter